MAHRGWYAIKQNSNSDDDHKYLYFVIYFYMPISFSVILF